MRPIDSERRALDEFGSVRELIRKAEAWRSSVRAGLGTVAVVGADERLVLDAKAARPVLEARKLIDGLLDALLEPEPRRRAANRNDGKCECAGSRAS